MEKDGLHTHRKLQPVLPLDLEDWLTKDDFDRLGNLPWIGFCHDSFLALFVGNAEQTCWEGHWWSRENATRSLTDCRKAIKMFGKKTGAKELFGLTPCEDKKALKMARLLGFVPQRFMADRLDKTCLLTRKEIK